MLAMTRLTPLLVALGSIKDSNGTSLLTGHKWLLPLRPLNGGSKDYYAAEDNTTILQYASGEFIEGNDLVDTIVTLTTSLLSPKSLMSSPSLLQLISATSA